MTLCDSSVICQYLEERNPEPSLYPHDIADRARARWLEEFADTRMGDVFIWKLFNQRVINPFVFGEATDEVILKQALNENIPNVLDYLGAFAQLAPFEDRMLRTPIAEHRRVLAEMGAPISAETYGTNAPRRGVMRLG